MYWPLTTWRDEIRSAPWADRAPGALRTKSIPFSTLGRRWGRHDRQHWRNRIIRRLKKRMKNHEVYSDVCCNILYEIRGVHARHILIFFWGLGGSGAWFYREPGFCQNIVFWKGGQQQLDSQYAFMTCVCFCTLESYCQYFYKTNNKN